MNAFHDWHREQLARDPDYAHRMARYEFPPSNGFAALVTAWAEATPAEKERFVEYLKIRREKREEKE